MFKWCEDEKLFLFVNFGCLEFGCLKFESTESRGPQRLDASFHVTRACYRFGRARCCYTS